jgi:hypothetical protein
MITLNDLLALVAVKRVTIYVPASPRVNTRIDFDPQDSAVLCDICELYGDRPVKQIGPVYRGDERLIVKLGSEKKNRGGGT